MAELNPLYREYQQKTRREFPVVVLEKQPTSTYSGLARVRQAHQETTSQGGSEGRP